MRQKRGNAKARVLSGVPDEGGAIIGVHGYLQGRIISMMPQVDYMIGRDPQMCDIVIMNDVVSRTHCVIRYDEVLRMYIIYDQSTNGVLVHNGSWTCKGDTVMVPAGTHISVGTENDELLLR